MHITVYIMSLNLFFYYMHAATLPVVALHIPSQCTLKLGWSLTLRMPGHVDFPSPFQAP